MSSKNVIVIGGGLAGLSSAVALAEAGLHVRLFEQRPFLGGRAASYVLPNGEHVDNCQHVTFGCCTNLQDFYERSGSAGKIRFFDRLVLVDPQGRRGTMKAVRGWPAPFHMPWFAFFPLLGWRDKVAIARAMFEIIRTQGQPADLDEGGGISMLEWLRRRRQTKRSIDRFWRVVLVSALSEELDRTDARYGVGVFWKAVLANRAGYRMGVPSVPLTKLYDGCRAAVERKGGEVILRAPMRALGTENGAVSGVQFNDDRVETADAYILAVPHSALGELLPAAVLANDPAFAQIGKLKDAPITGAHLWFDRTVMSEPFLTLLDSTTQWIFNKSALYADPSEGATGPGGKQYLQLVISGSYDLLPKSRQEIIDLCLPEVKRVLPAARDAQLVKATVIKETAATFSPEPGCDAWRPPQKTDIRGLYLAGDWTATGWPATMEGAVRSGYLAAEAILADAGTPRAFVQPDLPIEWPNRLLARRHPRS
jgi:squalene-associated FAD-dependent desaturase